MSLYKTLILLFFISWFDIKGQKKIINSVSGNDVEYHGIESIRKEIPDSIRIVFLGNEGLKEFPKEIFTLKNVISLNFVDKNIGEIYYEDSLNLSPEDRKLALKIFKKTGRTDRPEAVRALPIRNENKFTSIPLEIKTLTNLQSLYFSKKQISKNQLQKIKQLLPKCEVIIL